MTADDENKLTFRERVARAADVPGAIAEEAGRLQGKFEVARNTSPKEHERDKENMTVADHLRHAADIPGAYAEAFGSWAQRVDEGKKKALAASKGHNGHS